MDKELVPFWEEAYKDDNIVTFSSKPNATIKEFEHLLKEAAQWQFPRKFSHCLRI